MTDYSEAISKGVFNWMDANRDMVLDAIKKQVDDCMNPIIYNVSGACMSAIGKFLDDNKDEISTKIAAAIAASYNNRHPL